MQRNLVCICISCAAQCEWHKGAFIIHPLSTLLCFLKQHNNAIHGIMEWSGLEETLKIILFQPHCHEQRHLLLGQVAQSPSQPGLEHFFRPYDLCYSCSDAHQILFWPPAKDTRMGELVVFERNAYVNDQHKFEGQDLTPV